jgi:hypothetical protein
MGDRLGDQPLNRTHGFRSPFVASREVTRSLDVYPGNRYRGIGFTEPSRPRRVCTSVDVLRWTSRHSRSPCVRSTVCTSDDPSSEFGLLQSPTAASVHVTLATQRLS